MAEVYHIYDYHTVPVRTLATLASGLRSGSRVRMAMSGLPPSYTYQDFLLARISDSLQFLCWANTKDGQKNRNRPEPLAEKMMRSAGKQKDKGKEIMAFDSPEAFDRARNRAMRG